MVKLNCPSCGAQIEFKSVASVFAVCSFCGSTVVRRDVNVETLGKMAELPADMSPIQIGARGSFEGKSFEVVGRLKIGWSDGNWNEWYILFSGGDDGWLGEAQGMFMISRQSSETAGLPTVKNVNVGRSFPIGKLGIFQIDDVKRTTCVGSQGELPVEAPKGRQAVSVDLNGPDGAFANIDFGDGQPRLFVGRYVELHDLKMTGLRTFDGW